jgi:hypoxanthine-guanine phosphoribosyltransferase
MKPQIENKHDTNLVKKSKDKKEAGENHNRTLLNKFITLIKILSLAFGFLIMLSLLLHYFIHFDFIKISIEKTENILFNIISLIIGIILAPIIEKSFK